MKKQRLGESNMLNCGEVATIVKYNSAHDMIIKFDKTGELIQCEYVDFKRGGIKSHFTPSVFGVGIVGMILTVNEDGKQLDSYHKWVAMLERCYDKKLHIKHPTYIDCSVSKEWHYYPTFVKWYNENIYEVENETMCLDKDILIKGNKIYSPETCCFVPQEINLLFTKANARRGNNPIGVDYIKKNSNYRARCKFGKGESIHLGIYNNSTDAFYAYKKYKEMVIKSIADKYKNKIPLILYEALYKYEVEITD